MRRLHLIRMRMQAIKAMIVDAANTPAAMMKICSRCCSRAYACSLIAAAPEYSCRVFCVFSY